jgi:hypothetical protein
MAIAMKRMAIKWTYLLALIGFGVWMFDVFFGGNIYLRGEGLVLGQPAVAAADYNVTVRNVLAREGERVAAGRVVVEISSQQLAETRARLSAEAASRAAWLADLDIRKEVVNATLAAAEDRETVAAEAKTQLNESYKKGLLSTLNRTAAAEQAYLGQKDAEALRAEKRALTDQLKMLTVATEQAAPSVPSWPIVALSCARATRCWNWLAITDSWSRGSRSGGGTNWTWVKKYRSMQARGPYLE